MNITLEATDQPNRFKFTYSEIYDEVHERTAIYFKGKLVLDNSIPEVDTFYIYVYDDYKMIMVQENYYDEGEINIVKINNKGKEFSRLIATIDADTLLPYWDFEENESVTVPLSGSWDLSNYTFNKNTLGKLELEF